MSYTLVADPKKKGYAWVVTETTGVKHSKKSLPLERAKAQQRVLYLVQARTEMKKPSRKK
jgi:hypothetical protein